jgi:glycosyltransferase involved in cell wall biosynthesis
VSGVHLVVPEGIDDPTRPSGGNAYDRRVRDGLAAAGWQVREHPVAGGWPRPDAADWAGLARLVAGLPDGATVLVDGLVATTVPEILVPAAGRLRLVVLVHMPLGDGVHVPLARSAPVTAGAAAERAVLSAAAAVVTTSAWTGRRLADRYGLAPDRVHVAEPGVDRADPAPGTPGGGELLCVAAVTPYKGHDTLLAALALVADRSWRCACVGALDRDPAFAVRVRAGAPGPAGRVRFPGVLTGGDLDAAYAAADVLVLASRTETYGMVVTEALARGLPVIATEVGGVPEALGHGTGGDRPGLLVPPGDPAALAAALRAWLDDAGLRDRLRGAAAGRRATLTPWSDTTARVARALVAAAPTPAGAR